MSEPRFEVIVPPHSEPNRVFADIVLKKQKVGGLYLVLMLLFGIGAVISGLGFAIEGVIVELAGCVALSVLYARMPKMQAKAAWAARNPALDISPVTYRFDETYIYSNHALTATTLSYRMLTEVVESEEYFLLYINKLSAYILPKSAFTVGSPEEFRQFLTLQSGLAITPYSDKQRRTRRTLWSVLVPVLSAVLAVLLLVVGTFNHTMTCTAPDGSASLSIDVPLHLTWDEDGDFVYLYNDEIDVYMEYDSTDELREMLDGAVSLEAFQAFLSDNSVPEGTKWVEEEPGVYAAQFNWYGEYSETYIFWLDDACFYVCFSCYEYVEEEYRPLFEEWRDSLVLKEK